MLILVASYIFIITLLIALDAIPIRALIKNKRLWMSVLSAMTLGILLFVWLIQGEQNVAPFLAVPFVVLASSLYELYREKLSGERVYHFSIPENTYEVEKKLGMNFVLKPMLKSTTGIHWDGKLIIMPQTFSSEGEALELICKKADTESEVYYCSSVTIQEQNIPWGKRLLEISSIIAVMALPMCFYLSKVSVSSADYWISLASGFGTCLIFGFAKIVLYGQDGSMTLRILRIVMTVFYVMGILGVIMAATGFYTYTP